MTPGNRITHRLLPRRQVAGASRQQRQALLQALEQRVRWEQLDEGGSQFNRQRQAIEPMANLRHSGGVGGHREVGLHGLRPLDKEANCLELEHLLERRQVLRVGQGERRKRVLLLAGVCSGVRLSHEHLQPGPPARRLVTSGTRIDDALEIIQDEQEPFAAEHARLVARSAPLPSAHAKHAGDGRGNQGRIV